MFKLIFFLSPQHRSQRLEQPGPTSSQHRPQQHDQPGTTSHRTQQRSYPSDQPGPTSFGPEIIYFILMYIVTLIE
ncbi:hypothetical protein AYI69_g9741 [Smittium culicis]|uniref:Uncharacterized protein n=1 Tax=Smittium culicis TaxID=133412 RepID=A0A1R1XAM2_9FUNG|nr:hypothetical protein AYI69_g9741 [Smittium culicis]